MKTWVRSARLRFCGGCVAEIAEGAPVLVISRVGAPWRLYRCEGCAGDAPPDLPLPVRSSERTTPMVKLGRVELPFDFKQKASGDSR